MRAHKIKTLSLCFLLGLALASGTSGCNSPVETDTTQVSDAQPTPAAAPTHSDESTSESQTPVTDSGTAASPPITNGEEGTAVDTTTTTTTVITETSATAPQETNDTNNASETPIAVTAIFTHNADESQPNTADFSSPQQQNTPSVTSTGLVRIAFAADFATGTGCYSPDDAGCDIYQALLNLNTGEVGEVWQITTTATGEGFPHWANDMQKLYYTEHIDPDHRNSMLTNLGTGVATQLLSMSSYFQPITGTNTAIYQELPSHTLRLATLDASGASMLSSSELVPLAKFSFQEPHLSKDGTKVLFHTFTATDSSSGANAQGKLMDMASKDVVDFTAADGSGHCGLNISGTYGVCDNWRLGGLIGRSIDDMTLGEQELTLADLMVPEFSAIDDAYQHCSSVSFNYPTYCGDDQHMVVSTSCQAGASGIAFSRLVLVDLSGDEPIFHPLGRDLANVFQGAGTSSWTVDCVAAK